VRSKGSREYPILIANPCRKPATGIVWSEPGEGDRLRIAESKLQDVAFTEYRYLNLSVPLYFACPHIPVTLTQKDSLKK